MIVSTEDYLEVAAFQIFLPFALGYARIYSPFEVGYIWGILFASVEYDGDGILLAISCGDC